MAGSKIRAQQPRQFNLCGAEASPKHKLAFVLPVSLLCIATAVPGQAEKDTNPFPPIKDKLAEKDK